MKRFRIRYSRAVRWLFAIIGMGPRQSGVEVDASEIRVCMGWAFRARVPRGNVVRAYRITDVWWWFGAHTALGGHWMVNGSAAGMVAVEIEPPVKASTMGFPIRLRRLDLSLEEPEGFIAAVTSKR